MLDISGCSVGLVGYGVSNKAMCKYLLGKGILPVVRCEDVCPVPVGLPTVFGQGYLDTGEDIVFRSPGVRPDAIKGGGRVTTEASYALENLCGFKVGVSGSDGKTTTSTLIYRMLTVGGKNAYLCGNIGKPIIDLASLACQGDFLVAELSSFQLMDASPCLDVAAITNISQNHLDWHRDMGEYIGAKVNIFKNARRRVLNYDDPVLRELDFESTVYFSLGERWDLVRCGKRAIHIVKGYVYDGETSLFPVADVALKGEYNLQNVLCATACVIDTVGKDAIHRVAREFCGVENRAELVGTVGGVDFVCSAIDTTPTRTKKTLSAFDKGRVVCILGGYDKSLDYECLRVELEGLKGVVICGENRQKIMALTQKYTIVNTLDEAVYAAYGLAQDGDTVLLSPASASFDMFKNYKEKASCFKRAVRSLTDGKDKKHLDGTVRSDDNFRL